MDRRISGWIGNWLGLAPVNAWRYKQYEHDSDRLRRLNHRGIHPPSAKSIASAYQHWMTHYPKHGGRAMLQYLCIGVTALSLTACVLLMTLWVRSYWRIDEIGGIGPNGLVAFSSERGVILYGWESSPRAIFNVDRWYRALSYPAYDSNPGILGFYYGTPGPGITCIALPYWFIVLLTATTAIGPWYTRRCRFSVRTILIATTLVAVVLGMIVVSS
jgi:hypothetical protein